MASEPHIPTSRAAIAWRETAAPTFALFTSLSTLVCCTLPAILITLGMGAALVSINDAVPGLSWLSGILYPYKGWVFGISLALLLLAWGVRYATRNQPCPADPKLARACGRLRRVGGWVLYTGFAFWAVGAFSTFVAPKLIA